jgi:hypothetical protein
MPPGGGGGHLKIKKRKTKNQNTMRGRNAGTPLSLYNLVIVFPGRNGGLDFGGRSPQYFRKIHDPGVVYGATAFDPWEPKLPIG